MKRALFAGLLLAAVTTGQPSSAADLPAKAPVYTKAPAAAPLFNWTGFYAGLQGGYGRGKTQHIDSGSPLEEFGISGWFGGVTAGFNWQLNSPWVVGVEADFSW